jgi:hypothetical protein
MYGLFNTCACTVVSIICKVTNPYFVTGFDIIQAYHPRLFYSLIFNIQISRYYMQTGLVKNK